MVEKSKPIKVLVVDDHPPFAVGLSALIDQQFDMESIGVAGSAEEALTVLTTSKPDVVVMDISMPGMSGIEATALIKQKYPKIVVLVLSAYGYQPYLLSALEAGAAGYLLKNTPLKDLLNGIRVTCNGDTVLDQALASKVLQNLAKGNGNTKGVRLDEAELNLLKLGSKSLSNQEIGERLHLSERTVQSHFTGIFHKLGVASRLEAIVKALKEGWLTIEDLK